MGSKSRHALTPRRRPEIRVAGGNPDSGTSGAQRPNAASHVRQETALPRRVEGAGHHVRHRHARDTDQDRRRAILVDKVERLEEGKEEAMRFSRAIGGWAGPIGHDVGRAIKIAITTADAAVGPPHPHRRHIHNATVEG